MSIFKEEISLGGVNFNHPTVGIFATGYYNTPHPTPKPGVIYSRDKNLHQETCGMTQRYDRLDPLKLSLVA